jgi:FO synthase
MAHRDLAQLLRDVADGDLPSPDEAIGLLPQAPLEALLETSEALTLHGFGTAVSYSRKVFVPLTRLCRDVCTYCTFAQTPKQTPSPYLAIDEVLDLARRAERAGCREALFTLGDQPEARYAAARRALQKLGFQRTIDYLKFAAQRVLETTGLLPHLNPGYLSADDFVSLRPVAASMGLMLESTSQRLCERGGPHWGSPDKQPRRRLASIEAAGLASVPFTSGLLIGIGETRQERIESLLALRELHERHGHIQELIIQNFCPKPGTRMAAAPSAPLAEQQWTIASARIIFGPDMSIQAPPNLREDSLDALIRSGVNDWGGVSPVTPDHVNPEAPWPAITHLEGCTAAAGRVLVERLAITPAYARSPERWLAPSLATRVRHLTDATGYAREDSWYAGSGAALPAVAQQWGVSRKKPRGSPAIATALRDARAHRALDRHSIRRLFDARGSDFLAVLCAADEFRQELVGDAVSYVVNRNINYTNICEYHCGFCAFSKGRSATSRRGPGYLMDLDEIARRAVEAQQCGATEVCLQGGIHPAFDGHTYLNILAAIKAAAPALHIHAFSPLEILHGATTLHLNLETYLQRLKRAGLASLPGTAAEILVDGVRDVLCPDKLRTRQWLQVMDAAHRIGLRSTATIMFGHVDTVDDWAEHLGLLRAQQQQSGGFTEFVPLPFVHNETPLWRKGLARSGPSLREAILMHAVSRLVFGRGIPHIQASWVKMGLPGLQLCLQAGADDMGGTLMNESITRAAGGDHGQSVAASDVIKLATAINRRVWRRTTLYAEVSELDGPDNIPTWSLPGASKITGHSLTHE